MPLEERFGVGVGGCELGDGTMGVEAGELIGTESEVGFLECGADQQVDVGGVHTRHSDRVGSRVVAGGGKEEHATVPRVDPVFVAQVGAGLVPEQSRLGREHRGFRRCSECVGGGGRSRAATRGRASASP